MNNKVFFFLLWILSCFTATGRNIESFSPPNWINGYFKEYEHSYIEVVSAFGYNIAQARKDAIQEAISRRSLASGTQTSVSINQSEVQVLSSHNVIVKARIIDEYILSDSEGYRIWLLIQMAKNPAFEYEQITVTDQYPFSPKVFLPGMAQIHKGQTMRGTLFIAGELAAIGGIVTAEGLRSSYLAKIERTHSSSEIQTYINQADKMQNARNFFIAGAAALYVWNIIDGIIAKGEKHIIIGNADLSLIPYADPTSSGLLLSFNF